MTLVSLTPCQTFMMNYFAKTFNNFTSFAINAKYELTICLSLKVIMNTKITHM